MTTVHPQCFLFDLDGTLIDSIELILASFRHTMATHLGEIPDDSEWLRGVGTPLVSQLRRFASDPAVLDGMVATYREHNLRMHDQMVREYPGVPELLATLRQRGHRLGIVTSKANAGARRGLARCGIAEHFEVVIGADDVTRHKPDPEPVLLALERMGAVPDQAAFVGDSPHDMHSGRAAGVVTVAALWGPFSRADLEPATPDRWAHHPAEVAHLFPA